jgi:hypothetical protein
VEVAFDHLDVAHGDAVAPKLAQTGLPDPALHKDPGAFPEPNKVAIWASEHEEKKPRAAAPNARSECKEQRR